MGAGSSVSSFPSSFEIPAWKTTVNHVAAFLTAVLFVVVGVFKIVTPYEVSRMMENLKIPYQISLPFTLALGVVELFAGILVLVPRFRRWGGTIASLLLLSFMLYIGINYNALVGQDCSCFPWLKRAVNIWFFPEDGAMLALALLSAWWARPSYSKRGAAVVFGACLVFAGVSFGAALTHQTGTKAPDTVMVDSKPFSLQHGRVFVFFFDPECSHCNAAAKTMGTYKWKSDVQVVGVPTRVPQWAEAFMKDNNFKGVTTLDLEKLKTVFPFGDAPYGVALENGRELGPVSHYEEGDEPRVTLKQFGFVE
jgi:uncharacterized membrane protein YphA (DoxX/SURF4 family)